MDLKKIAKNTGKKQKDIAEEVGISGTMLSLILSGKKLTPIDRVKALSKALGIHPRHIRPDIAAIFEPQ